MVVKQKNQLQCTKVLKQKPTIPQLCDLIHEDVVINSKLRPLRPVNPQPITTRQWPEVYDLCRSFVDSRESIACDYFMAAGICTARGALHSNPSTTQTPLPRRAGSRRCRSIRGRWSTSGSLAPLSSRGARGPWRCGVTVARAPICQSEPADWVFALPLILSKGGKWARVAWLCWWRPPAGL